jgi:hypothetical protein
MGDDLYKHYIFGVGGEIIGEGGMAPPTSDAHIPERNGIVRGVT